VTQFRHPLPRIGAAAEKSRQPLAFFSALEPKNGKLSSVARANQRSAAINQFINKNLFSIVFNE